MKHLFFVSYSFPPHLTPESLLAVRTVAALERLGWRITVFTIGENSSFDTIDENLSRLIPPSTEVVRTANPERFLSLSRRTRGLMHRILSHFGFPEIQFGWCFSCRQKGLELVKSRRFDAIHSWASYHTSNVVGLSLKRATGLPWIAHFSDPWVDNPYSHPPPLQERVWRRLEEAIIRNADAVVFTAAEAVDLVMRKYPASWQKKTCVIPHGYDSSILASLKTSSRNDNKLRLVYTGAFYGIRTPEWLLKALQLLNRTVPLAEQMEVIFIGPVARRHQQAAGKLGLDGIVKFCGARPFLESLQAAAEADVLLVIDAASDASSVFLPSKIVDYMMFRKPILGLTPMRGPSADLLRRLECPVVAPDDVPAIAGAISTLLEQRRANKLAVSSTFDSVAREYDINQTTRTLDDILKRLLTGANFLHDG